jgi:hypothetical protein
LDAWVVLEKTTWSSEKSVLCERYVRMAS